MKYLQYSNNITQFSRSFVVPTNSDYKGISVISTKGGFDSSPVDYCSFAASPKNGLWVEYDLPYPGHSIFLLNCRNI